MFKKHRRVKTWGRESLKPCWIIFPSFDVRKYEDAFKFVLTRQKTNNEGCNKVNS